MKPMLSSKVISTSLRRGLIPSDQSTFTCCDILEIGNEEISIHVAPMIIRLHEEYFVVDQDVAVCSCQVRYKIPYRAIGNKLRDVQYVTADGTYYKMTRVSIEDRTHCFDYGYGSFTLKYYVDADGIVLLGTPTNAGSLRFSYYLRPSELVLEDRAGTISSISTCSCAGTTTYTLTSFPDHFNSTCVFDVVQSKSPNKISVFDKTKTTSCSTAKTITFTSADLKIVDICSTGTVAANISVGDYVMKAEESIVPQLPTELHPILAQRIAVKMLEALGDTEGMQNAQKELERMEFAAGTLVDNRSEGSPQKILNKRGHLRQIVNKSTR